MKKLCIMLACAAGLVCITAFVKNTGPAVDSDTEIITMRSIGHNILLQAGDATVALPPVKALGGSTFKIQFPHAISFVPERLVSTVSGAFTTAGLPQQYIVKVVDGATGDIVYGFAVSGKAGHNIIPCLGRAQPVGNYYLLISTGSGSAIAGILSGYILPSTGLFLAVCSLAAFAVYNKKQQANEAVEKDGLSIGQYVFYTGSGILKYNGAAISLTAKEIKLLAAFAAQPNTIIGRQELIKCVWEDEGVLTGSRSLDVFVSKLRKKLAQDPCVTIVNAHGTGYRLEVAAT